MRLLAALLVVAACTPPDGGAPDPAAVAPALPVPAPPDAGAPPIARPDPADDRGLDVVELVLPRGSRPRAPRHTVELVLRSTPPGAIAAVDGTVVGPTPAYWHGEAKGRPMEFTFVLPLYAMARYRFVPVRSGVVHATLRKLMVEPADAGP